MKYDKFQDFRDTTLAVGDRAQKFEEKQGRLCET